MKVMSIRTVTAAYMIHPSTSRKWMVVMVDTSVGVVEHDDSQGEPLKIGRDKWCASTNRPAGTAVIANVRLRKTVVKSSWMRARNRLVETAMMLRRESQYKEDPGVNSIPTIPMLLALRRTVCWST
ncbi:hypothetical protein DAPPUDRAFT_304840 [Daphnia pulex]|uniref:Uncharacterized protein n=1 Tax=Daphnia pulex TaxID=6669 RepID=E9GMI1_DAPPU|nr:hypothetical protein DAPPUDRAFT_304840 [Daphnia pulex]|eukprot:EFX79369.1 hypothetical protein DAPPUDRAFT_304840 [Daphnia pulex]